MKASLTFCTTTMWSSAWMSPFATHIETASESRDSPTLPHLIMTWEGQGVSLSHCWLLIKFTKHISMLLHLRYRSYLETIHYYSWATFCCIRTGKTAGLCHKLFVGGTLPTSQNGEPERHASLKRIGRTSCTLWISIHQVCIGSMKDMDQRDGKRFFERGEGGWPSSEAKQGRRPRWMRHCLAQDFPLSCQASWSLQLRVGTTNVRMGTGGRYLLTNLAVVPAHSPGLTNSQWDSAVPRPNLVWADSWSKQSFQRDTWCLERSF